MKIYMKLFGIFGVILLTQISCSSKNYHQPKGKIEKLTPSKYQKPLLAAKVLKLLKILIASNINFHLLPMSGLNGVGNINGLRPLK